MDILIAEFIGTTILLLLGIGVNANTSLKNTIGNNDSAWVLVTMAWGLSVFIAVFTFANPHVYLDTMILIGSVSQQFFDINRIYFAIGACLASFVWFFTIAYGAKLLTPIMIKPSHWRTLDLLIALIMFVIAFNLASQGNWI